MSAADDTPRPSEPDPDAAPAPAPAASLGGVVDRLGRIEQALQHRGEDLARQAGDLVVPVWRQVTEGEPRWPASLAIVAAVALQVVLPTRLTFGGRYLLPALELALLVGIVIANPLRINKRTIGLRAASIGLIAVTSIANAWAAGRLVHGIVTGQSASSPTTLLGTGASVWITNVIVFALWYWELDQGGPALRARGEAAYPDFLFAQMTDPKYTPPGWKPAFVDYLFVSFTNATAFSPTDTLPLARWAKLTMLAQSGISLVTVGLVVARAVNVLR
ncbi:MAG TPA: hypothetical protein VHN98_06290 [Acidimicrobiales bacterium]|nr:hypothetical protein [Acidimicrobiales bacterium]